MSLVQYEMWIKYISQYFKSQTQKHGQSSSCSPHQWVLLPVDEGLLQAGYWYTPQLTGLYESRILS